ncbi:NAD(+) diphosphatase [Thermodesulfobacteriota bacterium]
MPFTPGVKPPIKIPENALWFLFENQQLLLKGNSVLQSPDLKALDPAPAQQLYLGSLDGRSCYAAELSNGASFPDTFSLHRLLSIFSLLGEELIGIAGLANQLVYWDQNHRYCGKCGNSTENKEDERAKICPKCGVMNFPRLSPAIIVAVVKDHQILLGHAMRFPTKFYSVLAGFVEPGESLEECVKREVLEEVGIAVKNIRYFGSQPWPYPDSLMIAFTAEYADGEIKIDRSEIDDAGWFSVDDLPPIPSKISIAGHLIDWFTDKES